MHRRHYIEIYVCGSCGEFAHEFAHVTRAEMHTHTHKNARAHMIKEARSISAGHHTHTHTNLRRAHAPVVCVCVSVTALHLEARMCKLIAREIVVGVDVHGAKTGSH